MPGCERPGIARRLREADEEQREGSDADGRVVILDDRGVGELGSGKPAGHGADERDSVRTEIEQPGGEQPAGHQHEGARNGRRHETQAENHGKRDRADDDGRPVHVAERLEPSRKLAPGAVSLGGGSGQLRQLSDDHVDGGAGQESGDHRAREELGDPAHAQQREQQEQIPVAIVIAATSSAASSPPTPVARTAPPATAASDELGPVEM